MNGMSGFTKSCVKDAKKISAKNTSKEKMNV